ncbi:MAG TPA: GtrA family protein [Burkholderiales bacterium]|nr:GtrA family protein [Burkholderiales bacterium]
MRRTLGEIGRFLVVGGCTAAIDFLCYHALLWGGFATDPAKGTSFVVGTVFAWFANRSYTFSAAGGLRRFAGFLLLYAGTLVLNVAANRIVLELLPASRIAIHLAFIIATGLSAAANFVGMKFLVFRTGT